MNIYYNIGSRCEFRDLMFGDVFMSDGNYYMKTYERTCHKCGTTILNSVNLENGEICNFSDGEQVLFVEAELKVK